MADWPSHLAIDSRAYLVYFLAGSFYVGEGTILARRLTQRRDSPATLEVHFREEGELLHGGLPRDGWFDASSVHAERDEARREVERLTKLRGTLHGGRGGNVTITTGSKP